MGGEGIHAGAVVDAIASHIGIVPCSLTHRRYPRHNTRRNFCRNTQFAALIKDAHHVAVFNPTFFGIDGVKPHFLAAPEKARPTLVFSEWLALFKRRTTWGMILGFSGVNYTGWLYIAWLPGYLQAQQGLSLAKTGWVAAIPFLAAAVGMWVNGLVVDALARRGYDLAKTRKTAIVVGLTLSALGTLLVVQSNSPTQAVAFISMALLPGPRPGGWYR